MSEWTLGLCLIILLAAFYYYIFVFRLDIRHLSPDKKSHPAYSPYHMGVGPVNVEDDHAVLIAYYPYHIGIGPSNVEDDKPVKLFSLLKGQRLTPKRRVKTSGRRQNV